MKTLLLTDIPPCKNLTAGLVLDQLCRFLPQDSIACFCVINPYLGAKLSEDLNWIPIKYWRKPRENALRPVRGKVGTLSALIFEQYNGLVKIREIVSQVVEFGREQGVDRVWCVLQGQTMIRLARPVVKGLNVPLYTQVWDPPQWWLRANNIDMISGSLILKEYEQVLRESSGCATASWAMAESYKANYGTRTVPMLPGIDPGIAKAPSHRLNEGAELTIGMAGQLYSTEEWETLLSLLDDVGWQICNRKVKIRLMGRSAQLLATKGVSIEFLGWRSQEETIRILSETDIMYCPYWFDPQFKEEASLSFPSKLSTYLAAGRAVLFHGPAYASPARFLAENDAGVICGSLEKVDLLRAIESLVTEAAFYERICKNGAAAFSKYLTTPCMQRSFFKFLGIETCQNIDDMSPQ